MDLIYIFVVGLLLFIGRLTDAAAFTSPSVTPTQQFTGIITVSSSPYLSEVSSKSMTPLSLTSLPPISSVTPPPSLQHLELRQRCWNDQGFSVNCNVWTGYRYTWGPASNPYDYWSGNGGSGSGGTTIVSNDGIQRNVFRSHVLVLVMMCICVASAGSTSVF